MIPKQAIEKAIEGGWVIPQHRPPELSLEEYSDAALASAMWGETICDPTFWQALGKALGWEEFNEQCPVCESFETLSGYTWSYHAHRFYDLILTGGDTEKFWRELLQGN